MAIREFEDFRALDKKIIIIKIKIYVYTTFCPHSSKLLKSFSKSIIIFSKIRSFPLFSIRVIAPCHWELDISLLSIDC